MLPAPDRTTRMPCGIVAGVTSTRLLLSTVRGPDQGWLGRATPGRLAKRREDAVGPVLGARGALPRRLASTIRATVPGTTEAGLLTRTLAVFSVSTVGAVTDVRCALPEPTVTTDGRPGQLVVVMREADEGAVAVVVSAVAGTSTRLLPICTTKNGLGTVALLWVVEAKPGATGT